MASARYTGFSCWLRNTGWLMTVSRSPGAKVFLRMTRNPYMCIPSCAAAFCRSYNIRCWCNTNLASSACMRQATYPLCTSPVGRLCGSDWNIACHSDHVMYCPDLVTSWVRAPSSHFFLSLFWCTGHVLSMAMFHSKACAVAVPSNTVLLNREFANSATIASNVCSALLWYSCHPLSALMGQPLGGCSTLSRSLTTLIMVPATGMSTRAFSPKHPILASQMESLITPCAAKCSMGLQLW